MAPIVLVNNGRISTFERSVLSLNSIGIPTLEPDASLSIPTAVKCFSPPPVSVPGAFNPVNSAVRLRFASLLVRSQSMTRTRKLMAYNRCGIRKKSTSRSRRGSGHIAQAVSTAVQLNLVQGCVGEQWRVPTQSIFPPFYEGAVEASQCSFPSHRSTHPSAGCEDRASSLKSSYTGQLASARAISNLTPSTTSPGDGDFDEATGNAAQFGQPSPPNAEFTLQGIDNSSHYPQGYRFSSPIDTAALNDGLCESGHELQGAQWDGSRWISGSDAPKVGSFQGPWNVCTLHHLGDSHAVDVVEEGRIFQQEYISRSGNLEPIHNISQWTQNTDQDWIQAQHSTADAQLPWQKAPTQPIRVENENPHNHTYTPTCSASFTSPQSSPEAVTPKPGIRIGPLSDFGRENARKMRVERTCFRCFFMKEQCVMQLDGICDRCRELGSKLRTWELPCTRVGLDKRAKYMLPDALVTQLKSHQVREFVKAHVIRCVPGSSLKLSLTLGSGTPLRIDAVEAIPWGKKATQMLSFRLAENGSTITAELKSPPILPYMADRGLIIKSANLWIDSMIRECDSDFVQNYLPEPHQRYERELLSIICQYHRDHIRELEASGEGPYQTLRWALKMTALNFIMGRPLVVPEDEVEALSRQLQHYQLPDTDEWVCPRLTNRIIKHMLLPLLERAVKRVLTDLSSSRMLRAKGGEEAVWDQAFCIMVLCLLVVGKTQASLLDRAEAGRRNDDHSFSFHNAKSAIDEMEIELSKHLIGMFHSRFGTAKARTGKGRPFNPLAREARLRPDFDSPLAKQVRSATNAYGSKILEAVDFKQPDPRSMKKMNVTRLLANFMHPFFQ